MDRSKTNALILAVVAVAIDQCTKWWALTGLRQAGGHLPQPWPIDFTLTFNQSNAFGLAPVIGQATRWLLMSVNLAAAALILYVILAKQVRPLTLFGLALVMAGAIDNALDRALIGAVVDLFDASKIGFVWIFNVADVTLDGGILLLLLGTFLDERRPAAWPH
jgi:signal peptidase II